MRIEPIISGRGESMDTSKKVVIAGYFGYGSAWDEAVLASLCPALRNSGKQFDFVAISGKPLETAAAHDVQACDWSDAAALSECVRRSEAVVIAGPSLFDPLAPASAQTGLIPNQPPFMTPAVLAAIHQKPILLYGVGLDGPVPGHMRAGLQAVCRAAAFITTRDMITGELLAAVGVPCSRIAATADPGWMLELRRPPAVLPMPRPVLGIVQAVGEFPIPEAELAGALNRFLEETAGSIMLAQVRSWPDLDEPPGTARLKELLGPRSFCVRHTSPEGLVEALAGCDAIVADHMQAAVFGLLARKPVLALACSPGILELRRQGLETAIADGCMLGGRRLLPVLHELCAGSVLAETIDTAVQHLRDKAKANVRLLLDALERPAAGDPSHFAELIAMGFRPSRVAASGGQETYPARRLVAKNREVAAKNKELAAGIERGASELAGEKERGRQADTRIAALESDLASLAQNNDSFKTRVEQLERQIERAERLRKETIDAVAAYEAQLDAGLRSFRTQRAWKVMLYIRKAYTVLVRGIEARKFPSPAGILSLVFSPGKNLECYDLQIPALRQALPAALQDPLESPPAESARPAPLPPVPRRVPFPGAPPQVKYDVVILPVFEFDFRFQRPQHLAIQFARAGHRVFWISPSRRTSADCPYEAVPLQERLYEIRLRSALPNIYRDELRPGHVKEALACLEELYRDFTVAASCSVAMLPFWHRLGVALRDRFDTKLAYDCMDDWQTMPDLSAFNRGEELLLSAEADVLVVTGQGLRERHEAAGRKPVLVRNGADFDLFSAARSRGYLEGIPRPIIGYFGAIADWFDYDLLFEVAQSRPGYSFVLVGGFGLEEKPKHSEALRLKELPNVHLLGHKPYPEIPAYLAEFDVCTIPFVLNEVTKATDPVKLYEYLSQGKPVVATPMRELQEYRELVYIAAKPAEFASALDTALAEGDSDVRRSRMDFAAGQGWSERWRVMDKAIRTAFPLVSILMVTHNSAEYVPLCLNALLRCTSYPAYEVIVVDNGSRDGTPELLEGFASRDPRVRVIRNEYNLGFAGGNNQAAGAAGGEYLIMLNVDTIPTPGWVERLMRHAAGKPETGLVVPVTNAIGNEAKIRVPYRNAAEMERFAVSLAAERMGQSLELTVGPLFCAFVPRAVWERVGPLDERFKVGMFEDDDFSLRVRNAGLRIVAAEDCFVHHFGGGSFSKLAPDQYQEVFATNKRLFEEKWGITWAPHRYRPGVTPKEGVFRPSDFAKGTSAAASPGD
jgi:GT2 family glycosyltransferase/glycosyltransferase involved in cell wall biosynthesis/polysaccharide pyruvyl transferase WcaK-like protein